MNIPPNLPVLTLPPLVFAAGEDAAAIDAASQTFLDVLSQAQDHPPADQRTEWPLGFDVFAAPLPDMAFAESALQTAENPQPWASAADNTPAPTAEGVATENVPNIAENCASTASVNAPVGADAPFVVDSGFADQDPGQAPAQPDPSLAEVDLSPSSDQPPDPMSESGDGPASANAADQDQSDEPAQPDGPQLQDLGLEIVSDMAEIDQSDLTSPGDPMPDAGSSGNGPSNASSSSSASAPILTQQGAALADHMIEVAQAAPDGPVTLTLSPDDLGTLCFEVQQSADGVSVHLTVERSETLDLLRRHADQLMDAFRQSGFSGASFTFGGGEGGQRDRPPPPPAVAWPEPIPPMAERFAVGLLDMRL